MKTLRAIIAACALVALLPLTADAGKQTFTEAACATSTTVALAAEGFRTYALFINDSDTVIYLRVGESAIVNEGVRLNANGGSWELSPEFGNMTASAVNCIHGGSGNKNLLVYQMDNS